jgi:hypothetical protein
VTVGGDLNMTATFTLITHTLTTSNGGCCGTLQPSAGGFTGAQSCNSQSPNVCTYGYGAGSVVTIVASPDSGSKFVGWTGACSGTQACVVTMDADETANATFGPA